MLPVYQKPYQDPFQIYTMLKKERNFKTQYPDEDVINIFNEINYFYLQRYRWNSDFYHEGIQKYISGFDHLQELLNRYFDDAHLRLSLLALINCFETKLRTQIIELYGAQSSDFYLTAHYTDPSIVSMFQSDLQSQNNTILQHFYSKYSGISPEQPFPPVWKAVHCLSLGKLTKISTRLDPKLEPESEIKNKLLEFIRVPSPKAYENTLDSITWLRNLCAHFDHIIARSPQYYQSFKNGKRNVGFTLKFIDKTLYNKNPNGDRFLEHRVFAWYYEVLYTVLKNTITISSFKDEINHNLSKIQDIVQKPGYTHLGFDLESTPFTII
ncbi:MAG: Abi family protein [Brevinema sp.]